MGVYHPRKKARTKERTKEKKKEKEKGKKESLTYECQTTK